MPSSCISRLAFDNELVMFVAPGDCALDYTEAVSQSILVDPDVGQVDEHAEAVGRTASECLRVSCTQDRDLSVASAGLDDLLGCFVKDAVV